MKRNSILIACALIVLVSAALWGANWRLDHPPLSAADRDFRALVAGADIVQITQICAGGPCGPDVTLTTLNQSQSRELIERLRLIEGSLDLAPQGAHQVALDFRFLQSGVSPIEINCWQNLKGSQLSCFAFPGVSHSYIVNPRFEKPLRRLLDEVAPNRIRP